MNNETIKNSVERTEFISQNDINNSNSENTAHRQRSLLHGEVSGKLKIKCVTNAIMITEYDIAYVVWSIYPLVRGFFSGLIIIIFITLVTAEVIYNKSILVVSKDSDGGDDLAKFRVIQKQLHNNRSSFVSRHNFRNVILIFDSNSTNDFSNAETL
jgi:hypothetical protein